MKCYCSIMMNFHYMNEKKMLYVYHLLDSVEAILQRIGNMLRRLNKKVP